ncbi:MAG: histone deacetylase family protein [Actinomycetota bacterium]
MKVDVLYLTHRLFHEHYTGPFHPERPARLRAVEAGIEKAGLNIIRLEAPAADRNMLERVHDPKYLDAVERFCRMGGGHLDTDTVVGTISWPAAVHAAGAGPFAIEWMAGQPRGAVVALAAVRPPGHHATRDRAMGFCLLNNVAVAAAGLRDIKARVAIIDWDVHHGNGTQEIFATDPEVLYISLHQSPLYPLTGAHDEVGHGPGEGFVINIPLPPGTSGDAYRQAWQRLVEPIVSQFGPDWLLISAGYDAHANDPLAELRLEDADYGWMATRLKKLLPMTPTAVFLEGGYHLPALEASVKATLLGFAGRWEEVDAPTAVSTDRRSPHEAFEVIELIAGIAGRYWVL